MEKKSANFSTYLLVDSHQKGFRNFLSVGGLFIIFMVRKMTDETLCCGWKYYDGNIRMI